MLDITQLDYKSAAMPWMAPDAPEQKEVPEKNTLNHRIVIDDAMDHETYERIIEELNRQCIAYEEE